MVATSAELSSLATALDELTRRVTVHAEAADTAKDEETARELFAIEGLLCHAKPAMSSSIVGAWRSYPGGMIKR